MGLIRRHMKSEGLYIRQLITLRKHPSKLISQKENAELKSKWYRDFSLLHFLELQRGISLEKRWQCYSTGWDTQPFAAVDLPSIPDDNCAICRGPLNVGKVRKPLCNHFFHLPCIRPWLDTCPNCPYCRKEYRILRPPKWNKTNGVSYLQLKRAPKVALTW